MKIHKIEESIILQGSAGRIWDFFSDPNNLTQITPPWLQMRIFPGVAHHVYAGMIIQYHVFPFGRIPMLWVTEITQFQQGKLFVDEQRFGPYRFWHHQHHFRKVKDGVEIKDIVHYSLPMGALGNLAHKFQVKGQLKEIFAYRSHVMRNIDWKHTSPK